MVIHTCDRCDKNFPKLWKLRRHQERQFQCCQKIILKVIQPLPALLVLPIIQSPKNQENDPKTDKFIDRHARKPREHMKTWGVRLHRKWFKVTGEELDLPLNLKECQRLHHELLQADDEAFEENIPQKAGPSEVEQQDA
ncbi:hypothetical protein GLOIN_2v1480811 [Rhizophagus clarus]|uniref:C2H2-type domain-containing protein n=1 Tax=Rhizophagus clarus TaxID=94130 RepID=A0A8H3LS69_9GLOM|nr:hypothetical protein GLOIN_2v1480811 [Rhizophagus clarus]